MVSRSFGRRLTEFEPVREALAAYVTRVGEKLRRDRLHARQMMIFLHNSPFDAREAYFSRQASFELPHPTSDTAELIHYACNALTRIFRPGVRYNKCGVMLTELTPVWASPRSCRGESPDEEWSVRPEGRFAAVLAAMGHWDGR
jgi:DNA polymerase V